MICAPPMMVRMSDACPGQSTSVYCTASCRMAPSPAASSFVLSTSPTGTVNAENPRSSVMPRSRDCWDLSSEFVDSTCDSALARDVLPLSTWPRMPTLMLRAAAIIMVGWRCAVVAGAA